jgi:hypothetical protein
VAVCLFLAASTYVVGGRPLMRRLLQARSRATSALQPPTQAEMQQAAVTAARDSTTAAAAAQTGLPPASIGFIAVFSGAILCVVVAAFYLTGRGPRQPRD